MNQRFGGKGYSNNTLFLNGRAQLLDHFFIKGLLYQSNITSVNIIKIYWSEASWSVYRTHMYRNNTMPQGAYPCRLINDTINDLSVFVDQV